MMELTRRGFLSSTALMTAAVVAGASEMTQENNGPAAVGNGAAANQSVFPYGAVYFRKSNPPEEDWARDHETAAHVGMNTFRHWFMWSVIEIAPGKFDWADYDQMMDIAHKNGIKVVIAAQDACAPEWAYRKYPHAHYQASDGSILGSDVGQSSACGGFRGLCLDNPNVRGDCEGFLTALIERYRNHPALLGYDLWNENIYDGGSAHKMYCYCDASKNELRKWLRTRYGSLTKLGKIWHRYSYESWDDVQPPESFAGYPESLDWLEFRSDNAFRLLDWRVKLFRTLDPHHLIIAHGIAETLGSLPSSATNEWRSAEKVDVWGMTWVAGRKGTAPWKQFQAIDLVRAGSRGKPFWHAEAQGGPLWMQPQVIGKPISEGRIPDEKEVRVWNFVSCAGGAKGFMYCRWRPMLDGPLFGAFAPCAMDGSVTPRTEMAGKIANWANKNPEIWKSSPVKGDIGIAFVPESELFNYVQQGDTEYYSQSARGAYQAFFDSNIQPDFVALDDLAEYKIVYLPYPVMLKNQTVAKLRKYVEQGGTLISEGLPAYFGDHGHVGTTQPNYGLDEVFGARESYVEFLPDISNDLKLEVYGSEIYGHYFRQEYEVSGGKAVGHYSNGNIAAVENKLGQGRTLLIGSFPAAGYYLHHALATRDLFAGLLKMAEVTPRVIVDDNSVQARLHQGPGGTYLWVVNQTRDARSIKVALESGVGAFGSAKDLWGNQSISLRGRQLSMNIPAQDAAVVALQ